MTFAELLQNYWPIMVATFTAFAWLIRLESATKANAVAIENSKVQRVEDLSNQSKAFDKIESHLDSIQDDIKALLRKRTI